MAAEKNTAKFLYDLYVQKMKGCYGEMSKYVMYERLPQNEKQAWADMYNAVSKDAHGAINNLVNTVVKKVKK